MTAYKIAFIILLVIVATSVACCDDPAYETFPYYDYSVSVSGLDEFTTEDGSAVIMLPAPIVNETVILPFEGRFTGMLYKNIGNGGFDINSARINAWGYNGTRYIGVADTDHGKMIEAGFDKTGSYKVWQSGSSDYPQASNGTPDEYGMYTINKSGPAFDNLSFAVHMVLGPKGNDTTNATVASLVNRPLSPITDESQAKYTIPARTRNVANYTSYIYLDEGLKPVTPGNRTIDIEVKFEVVVGMHPYGEYGYHDVFVIRESIPENVTGYVPVTVQYLGDFTQYPIMV